MNALLLSFSAAGCAALSSLFFRKNVGNSKATSNISGYLLLFYFFSFILSCVLYPGIWKSNVNFIILGIGVVVGLLNSILMFLTSRALNEGPAGLTYAFQNASAIFPGIILFLLLGSDFGFSCSYFQMIGMILVLLGLFLGAKKESLNSSITSSKWLKYALACFFIQILALTFIQARCLLFDCAEGVNFFSDFTVSEVDDAWFMPGQFGASLFVQSIIFLYENKKLQRREVIYGSLGGFANFSSTCLLLLATKGILFPCFAVASMILCNVWANKLYSENFNLKTNALCSLGIFMAVFS